MNTAIKIVLLIILGAAAVPLDRHQNEINHDEEFKYERFQSLPSSMPIEEYLGMNNHEAMVEDPAVAFALLTILGFLFWLIAILIVFKKTRQHTLRIQRVERFELNEPSLEQAHIFPNGYSNPSISDNILEN